MAETAGSVIKAALTEILVQASEAPLEPDDFETGRQYLNRMMAGYAAVGINVGFTQVQDLKDPITVPDGALEGIVMNLAKRLTSQYERPLTPQLQEAARDGLNALRSIGVNITPTSYPDTLPVGSGNESNRFNDNHFYRNNGRF